jgi:high-affinity Fe2+/Pb2+ permease
VAASAAVRTIAPAVAERVQGEQPSRLKALVAATAVGAAAAVAVYRLLRSVPAADDSE